MGVGERWYISRYTWFKYKVVQIWPGQTVTCLHTNSPGHIWTTLYVCSDAFRCRDWKMSSSLSRSNVAAVVAFPLVPLSNLGPVTGRADSFARFSIVSCQTRGVLSKEATTTSSRSLSKWWDTVNMSFVAVYFTRLTKRLGIRKSELFILWYYVRRWKWAVNGTLQPPSKACTMIGFVDVIVEKNPLHAGRGDSTQITALRCLVCRI